MIWLKPRSIVPHLTIPEIISTTPDMIYSTNLLKSTLKISRHFRSISNWDYPIFWILKNFLKIFANFWQIRKTVSSANQNWFRNSNPEVRVKVYDISSLELSTLTFNDSSQLPDVQSAAWFWQFVWQSMS